MKVYRIPAGTYFEKQEDARKADRKFATVEFPFSASPKADFVDWLNNNRIDFGYREHADLVAPVFGEGNPALVIEPKGQPTPQPTQPVQPQSHIDRAAIDAMWPSLDLAYRFGLCAMTMEDARNTDFFGTTPAKAAQRYGEKA